MTYKEWQKAIQHAPRHLRVKGAWGHGTILARPFAGARTRPSGPPIWYVGVHWDRGLNSHRQLLSALTLVDADAYDSVQTADCPECGIEAMIFYEGDYICAWCREQLEDGIGPLAD